MRRLGWVTVNPDYTAENLIELVGSPRLPAAANLGWRGTKALAKRAIEVRQVAKTRIISNGADTPSGVSRVTEHPAC